MKNKNNGFTLIELLAVIVILAIIALIATPIVLNIISESKESATLQSAQFYMDAVENAVAKKIMDEPTFRPTSCDIQSDGNLKCGEFLVEVEIKGEKPTSGTITLKTGKITEVTLVLSEKTITKNTEGKLVYGEPEVQLESGLYDAEGNLIASWDELVNDYGINVGIDYNFEDQSRPGYILSTNENLNKGVKLVIDDSVTKIGDFAFYGCTTLTEVIIPDSVIGEVYAFHRCTSLEKIIIGNNVTRISGFVDCINLEEVIIGNNVTEIDEFTFSGCTSLKEIIIPDSVTYIGIEAFDKCTSLTKVVLGNSVTHIDNCAFVRCSGLTEITLPKSITNIDIEAFALCTSLKTINYTGTQEDWNAIDFEEDWNYGCPSDYVINYNYVVQ